MLLEAFRPGVAERLGLGPGDGDGPQPEAGLRPAHRLGAGRSARARGRALAELRVADRARSARSARSAGPPVPLLQVLGDFAGGGLHLAYGVVCALLEASRTGKGQVVDAAMLDGVMSLYSVFYGMSASGMHTEEIGTNLFDGGAPFYNVYETSDGKYVTAAPIEPHFYRQLLDALGIPADELPAAVRPSQWPAGPRAARRRLPHPDPRRVAAAAGRHRRLLRAGDAARGGARASAQHRPRRVRRRPRTAAARCARRRGCRAWPATVTRSTRRTPTSAPTPTWCWPNSGSSAGGDRGPAFGRRGRRDQRAAGGPAGRRLRHGHRAGRTPAKLFADAGADVVKVEPPGGDPLRAWSASGATGAAAGALFRFLAAGKRSVVGAPGDPGDRRADRDGGPAGRFR